MMKKLLMFLGLVALFAVDGRSETVTFQASADRGENSVTKNGITVMMTKMGGGTYYQCNTKTALMVFSAVGTITRVAFTCTGQGDNVYGPGRLDGEDYSYLVTSSVGIWSGNSTSLMMVSKSTVRITSIEVEYVADGEKYAPQSVEYQLVKDERQLEPGAEYVLANQAGDMVMAMGRFDVGISQSAGVSLSGETLSVANPYVRNLTLGGTKGAWTLSYDGQYFLAVTSLGNVLNLLSLASDTHAQWDIDIVGTEATINNCALAGYNLYYNKSQYLFSCYATDNAQEAVRLYKKVKSDDVSIYANATLAEMESAGAEGELFTIQDDLHVVYVYASDEMSVAWAHDLNQNIDAVEIPQCDGVSTIDYVRQVRLQQGDWTQNNWILLDFGEAKVEEFQKIERAGMDRLAIIKGGTLKGRYTDLRNFTFLVSSETTLQCEQTETAYMPNVYIAANYNDEKWQVSQTGKRYWFMSPKVMEVAMHTWSVWNGDGFYVPERSFEDGRWFNEAGLTGAFGVDMMYNGQNIKEPALEQGDAYEFLAVTLSRSPEKMNGMRRLGVKGESVINDKLVVAPLNLNPDDESQVVTGLVNVVDEAREQSRVYCDLMGRTADRPFRGVNMVIVRYTDGTVRTAKVRD